MPDLLRDKTFRKNRIELFAPILYFHPQEAYMPGNTVTYLEHVRLRLDMAGAKDTPILDRVMNPANLLNHIRQGQHSSARYQSNFFLEILEAEKTDVRKGDLDHARCYVRVRPAPNTDGCWDIQYMFFYPYNGTLGGFGAHEGDWEHITVRVDSGCNTIIKIYYSAHYHEGGWAYERTDDNPNGYELEDQSHPVVFVAKDSHASYPTPGIKARSANKLIDPGAASLIGHALPDDRTAPRAGNRNRWACGQCLEDVSDGDAAFLKYSGLWGEVGPSFSGPHGPLFQPWGEDDDASLMQYARAIEFCGTNNSCCAALFRTTDDPGQIITEKLRRGFLNDRIRSLRLKNVGKGTCITLYDSSDGNKKYNWTRVEVLQEVDYYFLDTLEVAKTDPVVCVTTSKKKISLDSKVSRIEID